MKTEAEKGISPGVGKHKKEKKSLRCTRPQEELPWKMID